MRFSVPICALVTSNWCFASSVAFSSLSRGWGISRPSLCTVRSTTQTVTDAVELMKHYTQVSVQEAGTKAGLEALAELGHQCSDRQPYNFDLATNSPLKGSVLSPQRQVLPPATTSAFLSQVQFMEENDWLSTNPDSVDGLPSLHLNMVSNGQPLFPQTDENDVDDFQRGIQKLLSIVQPHIYDELLPTVREMMNSTDIVISDVFLRRYGQDIAGGETRQGISAHYDVFSVVTAVIAMDDVAEEGDNGLYTTARSDDGLETSNHASLRRFFPLKSGDGVVHSWDVLHGVDVEAGLDRTSLIVWFSTKEAMTNSGVSPWLSNHPSGASSDLVQFVLGSALESTSVGPMDGVEATPASMHHRDGESSALNDKTNSEKNPHELYVRSAAQGNPFALTRLGALCEDEALSPELLIKAIDVLSHFDEPPASLTSLFPIGDDQSHQQLLARRFWFEGALRGNPNAQIALGDEAMELGVASNREDLRVMAAILFGLAAQQGLEAAADSLSRVVSYEASISQRRDNFLASPVLQAAQAAMMHV